MKQKEIFLGGEADAWFERNHELINATCFDLSDPIINTVSDIILKSQFTEKIKVLEIGCGEAKRLIWMVENLGIEAYGIDPSFKAVQLAKKKSIKVKQGTADELPFDSESFDIVIFGFCLYLCDREDLFKIAKETDRVLKKKAWLIVNDFFSPTPTSCNYHHKSGVYSFKMDYRKLFDWHPAYTCFSHQLNLHNQSSLFDDSKQWVATSVLRKNI
jgi:ubiquinone/menaquinone biosynthesis C-methylase UbiE